MISIVELFQDFSGLFAFSWHMINISAVRKDCHENFLSIVPNGKTKGGMRNIDLFHSSSTRVH
jgi:hypothetical protein